MGVFIDVLARAAAGQKRDISAGARVQRGLGLWLMNRLLPGPRGASKLKVLEQLRVTPRQSLVLVEVEGERLLMAASDGSAAAFYPLSGVAAATSGRRAESIKVEGTCA